MSYSKLKIGVREILALVPASKQDGTAELRNGVSLPEIQKLVEAASVKTDAVAFGFVRGQWYPAA